VIKSKSKNTHYIAVLTRYVTTAFLLHLYTTGNGLQF